MTSDRCDVKFYLKLIAQVIIEIELFHYYGLLTYSTNVRKIETMHTSIIQLISANKYSRLPTFVTYLSEALYVVFAYNKRYHFLAFQNAIVHARSIRAL